MILIISVLLIQCFDGVSSILTDPILVEFSTDTLVTFNLDGELFIDSDSLENPTDISVGSSYVFIGDPYADYASPLLIKIRVTLLHAVEPKGQPQMKFNFCGHWILNQVQIRDGFTLTQES